MSAESNSKIAKREFPRSVRLYPLDPCPLSNEQLATAIETVLPLDRVAYHIGYTLHLIRVWGTDACFPQVRFARPDFQSGWGRRLTESLLDNTAFRSVTRGAGGDLLVPSPYGLQARSKSDGGFAWQFTAAHVGEYLAVMSELGIPSGEILHASDSKEYLLADVIEDDARRANAFGELEWVVIGLSRYLESPSWRNRFAEQVSIDTLTQGLIDQSWNGKGVCHGCHVPYSLSVVLQQSDDQMLSKSMRERVVDELARFKKLVDSTADQDGTWGANWARRGDRYAGTLWGTPELDCISVTGHLLEWMSITPPELRPARSNVEAAANRLLTLLVENQSTHWKLQAPYSHAVKALLGLCGYWFAGEVPRRTSSA